MSKRIRKKKARAEIIKLVEGSRHLDGILFVDGHAIKFACISGKHEISPDEWSALNMDCIVKCHVNLKHFKLDENKLR